MAWMSRHFWNWKNWHWVSSAICLIGMLLFAVTGITLNHAGSIESSPQTVVSEASISPSLLKEIMQQHRFSPAFRKWYRDATGSVLPGRIEAQWDDFEVYVAMPRAGGDKWFTITLDTGEFYQEATNRGAIAYLNDLHKGRNTPSAWRWFLDIFSGACIVFSVTGLMLLKRYAKGRNKTWPLVIAGLVIPIAFLVFPSHAKANELRVSLPRMAVAEYHAPYVAVWLANERGERVVDIAVWYDTAMADDEGEKWLKDLRLWWRRSGRSAELPIDGISGATRRPGTSDINLDGRFNDVPAGDYFIWVEAARELGGRETLKLPLTLPVKQPISERAQGKHELSSIHIIMEPAK
ncbi:MAG: PepSY-associated TM helix domain-containing protein [Alteromonadaceae bacterium]|nr:PepSY-associated TM helix domain-containing protein [Alteromonadaceae bacterium]